MNGPLLAKIESFLADTGMGETYFGVKAVGNSELVGRLRQGRHIYTDTERAVLEYIADERQLRQLPEPDCASAPPAASAPS